MFNKNKDEPKLFPPKLNAIFNKISHFESNRDMNASFRLQNQTLHTPYVTYGICKLFKIKLEKIFGLKRV